MNSYKKNYVYVQIKKLHIYIWVHNIECRRKRKLTDLVVFAPETEKITPRRLGI